MARLFALCPRCHTRVEMVAVFRRDVIVGSLGSTVRAHIDVGDDKPAPGNRRWTVECIGGHAWGRQVEFVREWNAAGSPHWP